MNVLLWTPRPLQVRCFMPCGQKIKTWLFKHPTPQAPTAPLIYLWTQDSATAISMYIWSITEHLLSNWLTQKGGKYFHMLPVNWHMSNKHFTLDCGPFWRALLQKFKFTHTHTHMTEHWWHWETCSVTGQEPAPTTLHTKCSQGRHTP